MSLVRYALVRVRHRSPPRKKYGQFPSHAGRSRGYSRSSSAINARTAPGDGYAYVRARPAGAPRPAGAALGAAGRARSFTTFEKIFGSGFTPRWFGSPSWMS